MNVREARDSLGLVWVPEDALYGPQTTRSLMNFPLTQDRFSPALIQALLAVKAAAATVNFRHGKLGRPQAEAIQVACRRLSQHFAQYADEFPLSVWQTGSGTQTNMNCNEVIARFAEVKLGISLHPNDDVNRSQSSNDVFPTAMHLAALQGIAALIDELVAWQETLMQLADKQGAWIKVGRTHLQDATPLTVGQTLDGWRAIINHGQFGLQDTTASLCDLAIGGTAVGTGLNAPPGFGAEVAEQLQETYHWTLRSQPVHTFGLSSHQPLTALQDAIATLATGIMKIVNDIRWLASGPRTGFGELRLPANEPGSSIMPGKVNPTQCEALAMIVCRVLGNSATVAVASSQGNFELNAYKPVMIQAVLESLRLMTQGMQAFRQKCLSGLQFDRKQLDTNVARSLMNVTALSPKIGYEQAAKLAQYAQAQDCSLVEAGVALKVASAMQLEAWLNPVNMV